MSREQKFLHFSGYHKMVDKTSTLRAAPTSEENEYTSRIKGVKRTAVRVSFKRIYGLRQLFR